MVGFFLNICPNVIDIPLAMAGIYNFSQNVIGLRSTCFAFEVNACISRKNNFYHINPQIRVSYIVYRLSLIVYRFTIFDTRIKTHRADGTTAQIPLPAYSVSPAESGSSNPGSSAGHTGTGGSSTGP